MYLVRTFLADFFVTFFLSTMPAASDGNFYADWTLFQYSLAASVHHVCPPRKSSCLSRQLAPIGRRVRTEGDVLFPVSSPPTSLPWSMKLRERRRWEHPMTTDRQEGRDLDMEGVGHPAAWGENFANRARVYCMSGTSLPRDSTNVI